MKSFGNANYYTLPSAAAADFPDPASVNDSATFDCNGEHSLFPVIVSDYPGFCSPTISYLPYRDPFQQVSQMRRLNEAGDSNVADKSMANSMPADIVYDYVTTPGPAEEDLLKMSSSDNYPVESGLKENFTTGCLSLPNHLSNNMRRSSSPANPADPEVLKSSIPPASSMCRIPAFSTVKKKTSFGLHLNSIASSMAPNSVATLSLTAADKDCYNLQTNNNFLIISSSEPKNTESGMPNAVKPVSEYEASDLGNGPSEPDVNQVNHQKKRKNADENDGCKRCNCKKSKCLKLYCDCFAAGVYCADSCACQGCFNKPIYVDTVVETRQQIESRNPIAFAPKVVQQYKTSPAAASNGNIANHSTPASARHKRGCNCKKSLCQKKYCECYQANVGCTIDCRCEGCKNVFGKKEDCKLTKDVLDQNFIEGYNATQYEPTRNSPSLAPISFLPTGSKFGGNHYGTTPSPPPSSFEPFGILGSTIDQSQIAVTSSTTPTLGNSDNLIYPDNGGFPPTDSPQFSSSLTHISQFNGVKVDYNTETDNTTQGDDTPDILKHNFNLLLNSANVRSPGKKRVSPPFNARGIERGSSSVPVMRISRKFILKSVCPSPPVLPMNDDGRHQTSFPPLMSCTDKNKPEDNDITRK